MTSRPRRRPVLTVSLGDELLSRFRATVVGLQRQGVPVTLAEGSRAAIESWCDGMEHAYNDAQPFPLADEEVLRLGRPIGTPDSDPRARYRTADEQRS